MTKYVIMPAPAYFLFFYTFFEYPDNSLKSQIKIRLAK